MDGALSISCFALRLDGAALQHGMQTWLLPLVLVLVVDEDILSSALSRLRLTVGWLREATWCLNHLQVILLNEECVWLDECWRLARRSLGKELLSLRHQDSLTVGVGGRLRLKALHGGDAGEVAFDRQVSLIIWRGLLVLDEHLLLFCLIRATLILSIDGNSLKASALDLPGIFRRCWLKLMHRPSYHRALLERIQTILSISVNSLLHVELVHRILVLVLLFGPRSKAANILVILLLFDVALALQQSMRHLFTFDQSWLACKCCGILMEALAIRDALRLILVPWLVFVCWLILRLLIWVASLVSKAPDLVVGRGCQRQRHQSLC